MAKERMVVVPRDSFPDGLPEGIDDVPFIYEGESCVLVPHRQFKELVRVNDVDPQDFELASTGYEGVDYFDSSVDVIDFKADIPIAAAHRGGRRTTAPVTAAAKGAITAMAEQTTGIAGTTTQIISGAVRQGLLLAAAKKGTSAVIKVLRHALGETYPTKFFDTPIGRHMEQLMAAGIITTVANQPSVEIPYRNTVRQVGEAALVYHTAEATGAIIELVAPFFTELTSLISADMKQMELLGGTVAAETADEKAA